MENETTGQDKRSFIATARRRQIVECAIEAIAALGYAEASLARIAERAGISKGVISYHFSSKEELIREVVTHVFDAGGAFMLPRILAESSATGMLRAYIESNLAFMRAHRTAVLSLVEILGTARAPDGRPLFAASEYEPVLASLEELLRRGQQEGEFRDFSPRVMAITIRAAIDAVPAQMVADPDLDVESYARELATMFDRATRAPPEGAIMRSGTVPTMKVIDADATVAPATERAAPRAPTGDGASGTDQRALGYLRAFVIALVVGHHAVIAYNAFAPPPPDSLASLPRWWLAFPVVDPQKSVLWALFNAFNDTFFMFLMFFLSGLFVWRSLRRKGGATFLRDRLRRLGLPFLLAAGLLAPIAYYPSYLQTTSAPSVADYARQWLSLGQWPGGSRWFLWLLLAFDAVCAAVLALSPIARQGLARLEGPVSRPVFHRPAWFFNALVGVSALAYLPLALAFGSLEWTTFGPFAFQSSRILLYAVYFGFGVVVGAYGIERGLLAAGGPLAQRWRRWALGALAAFGLLLVTVIAALAAGADGGAGAPSVEVGAIAAGTALVLSCAASSLALLAIFLRFANARGRLLDSLRDNAFGIYLLHYPIVSWLQYALLPASLDGTVKGALVFVVSLVVTWGAVALVRRVAAVLPQLGASPLRP